MKTRLLHIWEVLTSSYWFVPAVMMAGSVLLAVALLNLDERYFNTQPPARWLYSGGAEGARAVLATIAGSTITVAGVVFSITIVTLTQASSQFGPRLLRNFMRDTGNQVVLGTFVATFIFCLLVLRSIQGENSSVFVPHLSVTAAVLLSLASTAVLIYFIHHVSLSLQAPIVVAAVYADLQQTIKVRYPEEIAEDAELRAPENLLPPDFDAGCAGVRSKEDGYIQAVDQESLMEIAVKKDLLIKLTCRPGDYILFGAPLMHAYPRQRCDRETLDALMGMFIIGRQRTAEQDVEFTIHQLVEIAVRSLSTGINDPFTAIQCIDRLGSALKMLARVDLHTMYRADDSGRIRMITPISTFKGFVDAAFNQLRQYGRDSVAATIRMMEVIAAIAPYCWNEEQRAALRRQVEIIHRQAQHSLHERCDLADLEQRYRAALERLSDTGAAGTRDERHPKRTAEV